MSTTNGSLLLDAGNDVTMAATTTATAGQRILVTAGNDIVLSLLNAGPTGQVALSAGGDILDGNIGQAEDRNVIAARLRMTAGGTIGRSDLANVNPDANTEAIDTQVGFVAAQAATGIYIQEVATGGSLTVDNVSDTTVTVQVFEAQFRSTSPAVIESRTLLALDDLETTTDGPIKVRVDDGSLTINEGSDNDNVGVRANGTGNVLLRAYGIGADVVATTDAGINGAARISSGTGDITVRAEDDININARVFTGSLGTIYMRAENNLAVGAVNGLTLNSGVTASGDILLLSNQDIIIDSLQSTSGDFGLDATGDVSQTGSVTTAANVFVDAGGSVTMSATAQTAVGGDILIDAGLNIGLGLLQADQVLLDAGGDILDNNDTRGTVVPLVPDVLRTNVRANELRMVAGGTIGRPDPLATNADDNLEAIDLEVVTVAAQSAQRHLLTGTGRRNRFGYW